jgi:gluconate kinase
MLDSQLATLEAPSTEERAWVCDAAESPPER